VGKGKKIGEGGGGIRRMEPRDTEIIAKRKPKGKTSTSDDQETGGTKEKKPRKKEKKDNQAKEFIQRKEEEKEKIEGETT